MENINSYGNFRINNKRLGIFCFIESVHHLQHIIRLYDIEEADNIKMGD